MQILLLLIFAFVGTLAAVWGTQLLRYERRPRSVNRLLIVGGIIVNVLFSVLIECILLAGKPQFYYHTHKPGMATVKIFGMACLSGSLFYALGLMLCEHKIQKRSVKQRLVWAVLLGLCGAAILEIGYFNFRHFELIGSGAKERTFPSDQIWGEGFYFNRASWKFHPYKWDSDLRLTIYTSNRKIRNIYYEFDDAQPRTTVRIEYNDKAHKDFETISEHEFIVGIDRSYSVPIHTVGTTYNLRLVIPENVVDTVGSSYGISLPRIVVNQIVPLEFNPVRFVLCFLLIFLTTVFFPGSPIWEFSLNFRSVPQKTAVAFLLLLCFGAFAWTVFSSYTGSDFSMTEQKAALNDNYKQYDKLVDALMAHRYALLDTPHHYLEKLSDPYDMSQRQKLNVGYLWDTAYYNGKYYVYFGAVPAVCILLPYKLLTGQDLALDYPILAFCCLIVLGLYGIYRWFIRHCFSDISFGMYWCGLLLLITSLNLTWCLRRTLVYEMAITSGVCLAVWGIFFMLLAYDSGKVRMLWLFLSGACSSLAVGCRPTMIFAFVVVMMIAVIHGINGSKYGFGKNLLSFLVFLVPCVLVGLALIKYNYERFGDPFEFGITYQLTTENRAAGYPLLGFYGRLLSVLSSLFTMPEISMEFPFIHLRTPELSYNGMILNSDTILGVFAYPVMGALFILPVCRKRMGGHHKLLFPFCCACLAAALGICITASGFAIYNRYLTDYLYLAGLPAVFTLICIEEKAKEVRWQKPVHTVVLLCGIAGVSLYVVTALTGEGNWFRMINPLYYDRLRYAFSPWL